MTITSNTGPGVLPPAFDTHGTPKGHLRITLRKDIDAGVSLGHRKDLMPGETGVVPHGIAVRLLALGRATLAKSEAPAAPATGDTNTVTPEGDTEVDTPEDEQDDASTPEDDQETESPDPAATVRRPPPLKRR